MLRVPVSPVKKCGGTSAKLGQQSESKFKVKVSQ